VPLPTDFAQCMDPDLVELPLSSVDPFMALHFAFGMLLGVADFEAQQAYHRGKSRLHNAWLHGAGVVWGLGVSVDKDANEIRVAPGLALDGAGHELYLDADACVDIGAWYKAHAKDPYVVGAVAGAEAGAPRFDAYVIARFRPCLTREVPALSEPCEGSNTDTAFSRVAETIHLDVKAGAPPARPATPYARLRQVTANKTAAGLAALIGDAIDRQPAADEDKNRLMFPATDEEGIVLATITGLKLQRNGESWKLADAGTVSYDRRDTLLPTSELQYLITQLLAPSEFKGPVITAWDIPNKTTITLTADKALDAAIVEDGTAFAVSSKLANKPWFDEPFTASLGADTKTVTLAMKNNLPDASVVRVVVRGTGPLPLLGADAVPLGAVAAADADGRDFAGMKKRN
jgi:hypothetical protein